MSERHKNILKSTLGVAFATLLSRILGLARVMLESAVLGGGTTASGWHLAFMWPNLFRRLLGEGALGTALIPLITQSEERYGREKVRENLAVVFPVLGVVLSLVALTVSGVAIFLRRFEFQAHVMLALNLIPLLMPYTIFICLVGVAGAVLNTRKSFFLPALGALSLNIFLIAGLALLPRDGELLPRLSYLVLVSGAVQLMLMLVLMWYKGVFPRWSAGVWRRNAEILKELFRLALPGFLGGAALQLSFIADRVMAASLGSQAVPALAYTDRIVDLPIGIFAVSFGSVLMANMSRSAERGELDELSRDLLFGLRLVCFVCIPMAFFVIFCHGPLFRALLMRGNFTASDLMEAGQAAVFLGAGIPFFCALKIILPAFYARKKMKTVFYVSLICIISNIVLNYVLMQFLRQGGIALATVISSVMNNSILLFLLCREGFSPDFKALALALCRVVAASVAAVFAVLPLSGITWGGDFGRLFLLLGVFGIIYLAVSAVFRGAEFKDFFQILHKRKAKNG